MRFLAIDSARPICDASDATLFLGIYGADPPDHERMRLVQLILRANPLAAFVAGEKSEQIFDALLNALSLELAPRSMMTDYSTDGIERAMSTFLQSTWPSEDSFDNWRSYLIVSYGASSEMLRAAARRVIQSK
jgi:hypothetical protein